MSTEENILTMFDSWNLLKSLLSLHFTISFWKPPFRFAILLSQSTQSPLFKVFESLFSHDQPWYSYQFQGGLKIRGFKITSMPI